MANSVTHAALPFPVKGARFTIAIPYLDADGDPTDPTTPDTERSIDGAAFSDCTEEVTTITGSNGAGYITLTGDEMNASMVVVCAKVASGPKPTLATIYPRVLPVVATGTAQAGAAGSITLDGVARDVRGCIVKTTGGTGGAGGSGSLGNQARIITAFNISTNVATVVPNWETTPDDTTTYELLMSDVGALSMLYAQVEHEVDIGTRIVIIDGTVDDILVDTSTTLQGELDGIQADTEDIQSRLPAALSSGNIKADVLAINGSTAAAARLALTAARMLPGTVDNTAFTATTTILESDDITEATADHFNGRIILFTSGALEYQATTITDYELSSGRGRFTYTTITEAPANDSTFIII